MTRRPAGCLASSPARSPRRRAGKLSGIGVSSGALRWALSDMRSSRILRRFTFLFLWLVLPICKGREGGWDDGLAFWIVGGG
jgi:hypothetical protein